MERPILKRIGTPVEELDTPALVMDLSAMESNIQTVHSFFHDRPAKLRPHVKTHNCPAIGHLQLAGGGTVGGICVARVGQAEVFAQNGFTDILVANEVVTLSTIARLCGLAHRSKVTVAVDSPVNVEDLSRAAQAQGVTLNVLVDINCRLNRCGVEPGQPALELSRVVSKAKGLRLAGLMAYEGGIFVEEHQALVEETKKAIQPVLDTRELLEGDGLEVETVSVGGTHNYEIAGAMDGVTEVQAGSYVVTDHFYRKYRPHLKHALRVLGTVISCPEEGTAVADVGHKAISADLGLPVVDGIDGITVRRLSAEHTILDLPEQADAPLDLGAKLWLVPYDAETCINLYNYMYAVREGRLQAIWEISARGRYD